MQGCMPSGTLRMLGQPVREQELLSAPQQSVGEFGTAGKIACKQAGRRGCTLLGDRTSVRHLCGSWRMVLITAAGGRWMMRCGDLGEMVVTGGPDGYVVAIRTAP